MEKSPGVTDVVALVRRGVTDGVLAALRPVVIEPPLDAHPAMWRQSWIAWQEIRGFGSDLITPPDHYRPNPYWSPPQIRLWAYNRAALLLVDEEPTSTRREELDVLLRFLGVRSGRRPPASST